MGLSVNEDWKITVRQFRGWAKAAVFGNALSLCNVFLEKAFSCQVCVRYCVGDVGYYLWSANLPKKQRDVIVDKLETVLKVLCNSVNSRIVDGDFERLKWGVDWVLGGFGVFSRGLFEVGLLVVDCFVKNWANYVVVFVRLVVKGVQISMTDNLIERLVGEVAKGD
ncbi:MAG: hypothetical protein GX799_10925 [Crenarchaeota archaeon]|nr:hypothetical protein [Thermoproteota archaeon]